RKNKGIRFAVEHRIDIHKLDPAARQLGSISSFAHVGFGVEQARGVDERLLERQMLKGVQGVVMDEYSDRPLSWEQMRRVFDRGADSSRTALLREARRGHVWVLTRDFVPSRAACFSIFTLALS